MQIPSLTQGDNMSKPTPSETTVHDISSLNQTEPTAAPVEKKPNAIVRGYRKIKQTPPKTAVAVVLGVGLVSLGAALGRKTAPLHLEVVDSNLELEPMLVTPFSEETEDTQSA